MKTFVYQFEDGTTLRLLDHGLSTEEMLVLKRIHGALYAKSDRQMRIHQLKILDCFADEIIAGNKMFELRENDRGYQKGDYICFTVISDESGREIKHAINTRLYEITCVLSGWGLMDGYVALGIREANHEIN